MSRKLSFALLLALLVPLVLVAPSSATLIVFDIEFKGKEVPGKAVMENTGGEPVVIYRGGFRGYHSISPSGPDGAWVVLEDRELIKVRTDGTEPTTLLCSEGFYIDGTPYDLVFSAEWSPTGTEILVGTYNLHNLHGLLPADSSVRDDCTSDLLPLYPEGTYDLWGYPAWNDDGSRIAFFLGHDLQPPQLVVLERRETGWEEILSIPVPTPGVYPDWYGDSDNPAVEGPGGVLVFDTWGPDDPPIRSWLQEIDLETGGSRSLLENGDRVLGRHPRWSPDGSQLVFFRYRSGGRVPELVKWTYPNGPGEVIGYGWNPDWQRDPLVLTCQSDSDCVDGNPCTEDRCDLVSGDCSNPPVDDDTPCGINGWCTSGFCLEPECGASGLPDCDDGNECTFDDCIDWRCVFDPEPFVGLPCDDGDDCTTADTCDSEGTCIGELIPDCGCLPKGDPCSANDDCCSGLCHPVKGTCK